MDADEEYTVTLRIVDGEHTVKVKGPKGLSRKEIEELAHEGEGEVLGYHYETGDALEINGEDVSA